MPSTTYNINFIAAGLTYVTNTASASTQIATSLRFGGGDFVVFGPMNSASFGYDFSETAPVSVDKRGDWTCSGRFFTATALTLVDSPEWIKSFGKDEGGEFASAAGMSVGRTTNAHGELWQTGGTVKPNTELIIGDFDAATGVVHVVGGEVRPNSGCVRVGKNGVGGLAHRRGHARERHVRAHWHS